MRHSAAIPVFAAWLSAFAGFATGFAHSQPAIDTADLTKASLVQKIALFIEWPKAAEGTFMLCVPPDHPQLTALRKVYDSLTIADRKVTIQIVKAGDTPAGCRVLMLATRDLADMARYKSAADRGNILLIAEGKVAARSGAHVGFFTDQDRLRLEVNRKALEGSGLKASFRLYEVARNVE